VTDPAAKPPVFLLDTMSFIFRAYHAMQRSRPMSTRDGLPTAAIYVFVNMIKKLRQDFAPVYFAAVFDVSGAVFRDERAKTMGPLRKWDGKTQSFIEVTYDGYKANREAMPEDLRRQIPYIRRSLEALHIPILEAEGFEADDVIGTLAREAAESDYDVFIISGDKDMMQLVTPKVKILNPQKDNLILDPAKVLEVLGVPPEKVIDVMALRGDSVDNVPGVPGIGDKGSVKLIIQYGSVEAVLDRAAEVGGKVGESLQLNRDAAILSKELVTIDCHVPLALDLDAMKTQDPDIEACRELFTELEFTSMLRELSPAADAPLVELIEDPTPDQAATFYAAARETGFAFALDAAAPTPVEDSEEAPQQSLSLLEVAEAADRQASFSVGVCAVSGTALRLSLTPELRALLEDESVPKLLHDWKLALHVLTTQGVALRGAVEDTMLLSYALNPTHATQALADVAARHSQAAPSSLPAAAAAIHSLVPALKAEVEKTGLESAYKMDLALAPVLFRMEQAGVCIDKQILIDLSSRFGKEINGLTQQIHELAGMNFNIASPKQLGEVLFNRLELPAQIRRGKNKSLSTARDILEPLAQEHEIVRLVLKFRHLSKLKGSYCDTLPQQTDGESRIHTTFQAASVATGRLASFNPNLQQIPTRTELGGEIRAAFIASPGTQLLSADYSQIELRLLAHFSADPLLTRAYAEEIDIHALTASEVFGVPLESMDKETRGRAKAVNFGIVYGISPFGLATQLGIPQSEARAYIDKYFARYEGVKAFIEQTLAQTRRDGSVRTLFGRVRPIPDIESRNPNQRGFAERTAVNTPLQGTAADLIKLAMIVIDRALTERNLNTRMVLQVHDELLFEVPLDETAEIETLVKTAMEGVVKLNVPLVADIAFGSNWRDL
jgi:DNA polymerase-1